MKKKVHFPFVFLSSSFLPFLPPLLLLFDRFFPPLYIQNLFMLTDTAMLLDFTWQSKRPESCPGDSAQWEDRQAHGVVLFSGVLLQKVSLSGDRLQDSGPGPGLAVPGQRWGGELSWRTLGFTPSAAGHQRGALKQEPCDSPRLFLQSADC